MPFLYINHRGAVIEPQKTYVKTKFHNFIQINITHLCETIKEM